MQFLVHELLYSDVAELAAVADLMPPNGYSRHAHSITNPNRAAEIRIIGERDRAS
jgi:hypothetical protein